MSIALTNRVTELERRILELERKLADTAESLAYLHGHVLAMRENPGVEPPEKLKRSQPAKN